VTIKMKPIHAAVLLAFGALPVANAQLGGLLGGGTTGCSDTTPQCIGAFSAPFAEPKIGDVATSEKCILEPATGKQLCKPAAGTLTHLDDGRFLYFNALEGTENVEFNIVAEFGSQSVNDQTRVLSFSSSGAPSWVKPSPVDAGASNAEVTPLIPGGLLVGQGGANGALFCADVAQLADGRIMAVGGTDFYSEPGIEGLPIGVLELEGLKNARIFNPKNNTWTQTGSMNFGRWYPTVVNLANSDVFVVSGVTKLIKPVYPQSPAQSGRNVVQSETYNAACGTWSENGALAQRSLPLFARIHLLPNGHVLYNAAGQSFNPAGQGYDQALWNIVGAYDPATRAWRDVAYAGFPFQLNSFGADQLSHALNPTNPNLIRILLSTLVGLTFTSPDTLIATLGQVLGLAVDRQVVEKVVGSGMRGSTFSMMLPLKPDAYGNYTKAQFLTAGGIISAVVAASPGTYIPTDSSRIDTIDLVGGETNYSSRLTGKLNQGRWYGSGVLLPDTSVMVFSGANRDEVVAPGLEAAIVQTERFDPVTQTWKKMALQNQRRTYHNTAVLMADGRVLVGGHAPITTGYTAHIDLSALGLGPNDGRDPSFEIYSPPYVFRSDRPVISNATSTPVNLNRGQTHKINTSSAAAIDGVLLIRNTDTTHLVDADQRAVYVPIVSRNSNSVTVRIPDSAAVLPAGHYMLFISRTASGGKIVPSKSTPVHIEADARSCNAT